MKIGFDAKRLFHNFTGLGNYSRSLLKNLHRYSTEELEFHLYTPRQSTHPRVQEFLDTELYHIHEKGKGAGPLWRTSGITQDLKAAKLDIYHGLSHEIPLGLKNTGIKSVVSMHDLIFLRYPNYYPFLDRKIYDWKFSYAAKNADRIIAISQSTKEDLIHYYQTDPDRIEVIYQACDEQFYTQKSEEEIRTCLNTYELPNSYLLYVGSITERKNLLGLVKAIELLPPSVKIPLVILGQGKEYLKTVRNYIASKGIADQFVFCDQAAFSDFPAIYQQAKAFIYPSFFEGFGIPIIEALWSRTPVISSQTSSLPEAGGPQSLYINPAEIEDIAQAIEKVLCESELAEKMRNAGEQYVQRFHGKQLSQTLVDFYRNL